MQSAMGLARAERIDLANLLAGLTTEQWDAPSLCSQWRVRDVVTHMIGYEDLNSMEFYSRLAKAGFNPNKANANRVAELADRTPQQLLEMVRAAETPGVLTSGFGGRIALLDGIIHQQDIRRPLGIAREIPSDRLIVAMDFARWAPPVRGAIRARGVRLVATDLDWSRGSGPEVSGPAEALLMAMAARPCALADLDGPGKSTLAQHIS
ncbi:maleylpyruvate isomerase family mycothiol-dependent enzyme [Mycobacteroides franklinii]|uniref:maleylpyruvate isomerase family mycothiol-dependent enzyme n=1 Tax=Mycobacteroides franklinii TaxID=948102 RepID=UPI000D6A58C1|nr:maleylpyruvate isomerase family mycothiol-dependent enzyme [Mycobacteroides franklinii]